MLCKQLALICEMNCDPLMVLKSYFIANVTKDITQTLINLSRDTFGKTYGHVGSELALATVGDKLDTENHHQIQLGTSHHNHMAI